MKHLPSLSFRCILLGLTFSLLSACAPAVVRFAPGEIPVSPPPTQEESHLGAQASHEILGKLELSHDRRYTQRVSHVLSRLLAVTPSNDHWRVFIVKSDTWNASTTPGNYIYIFTELLDDLQDDSELAAVLAHEISHRLARHHVPTPGESLGKLLTAAAGLAVGIAMQDENTTPEDVEMMTGLTTAVMKGFAVNPYSQVKEEEADLIGLFLMADAGFHPEKAAKVWYDQAQEGGGPPKFFSTHPPSEERYHMLASHVPQALERYRAAAKSRKRRAKQVAAKQKPYQPNQVAQSHFTAGYQALQSYDYTTAEHSFRAASRADRRFADALNFLGVAQAKQGDLHEAKSSLRTSVSRDAKNGTARYNLACVYALDGQKEQALKELKQAFALEPTLKATARDDGDLFSLREDPRFEKLFHGRTHGAATFQLNRR